jgi:hypothetical protein
LIWKEGAPLPLFLKLFILKSFKSFVLKLRILKRLQALFLKVRILKGLANSGGQLGTEPRQVAGGTMERVHR